MISKTHEQILARIEAVKKDDFFGFETTHLVDCLPFEMARPFLKEGVTEDEWDESRNKNKPPLEEAREYLSFAWDKANNCRGLSAIRSIDRLRAWLWLAGFDAMLAAHFEEWDHYGKEQLVIASVISGFDWEKHDDGRWVNDESGPALQPEERAARVTRALNAAAEAKRLVAA